MKEPKTSETAMVKQKAPGLKQIELCADGKYRWIYEFNMLKNPTIFFTVLNIFGVLILVQVFLMTFLTIPENKGKKTAALNYNVKYKKKLVPGMRVDIEANLKSYRRGLAIGSAVGYVDGEEAVSAEFLIGIPDVLNQFKPKENK